MLTHGTGGVASCYTGTGGVAYGICSFSHTVQPGNCEKAGEWSLGMRLTITSRLTACSTRLTGIAAKI